ncbi:uncharacterized protein Z518_03058 [Rhinocladiella mackenziei CBS 650.93]|uniref:Kinase n=1 Tax=Rhinocladiella mackenziei CBS 650.93 TaxID=1442369 RepID=A0A0D2G1L3_9EURO|nr:uncharacterized protein Z518_03058 [Rhinocladiella mackenziei CBS 650.93]KIX08402.1 hypothetical protein Z518_03058 [Rhinocladiella mackenziei CBS 650.93]
MGCSTPTEANKKMAAMPSESELVAFSHSAAGHEGISSNASGSLIIKPCTQSEIDFYESAKDHPLFQAHMPTFIGSLCEHEDQDTVAPLLDSQNSSSGGNTDALEGTAAAGIIADPTPGLIRRATWKPSGGKKLSTGLAIVLENAAFGFKHPNVLDVKLGARLWDDDAPLKKRQKLDEVSNSTTSASLGFRVAGMKVWVGQDGVQDGEDAAEPNVVLKNGYKSYNKFYGQSFSKDTVVDAFTTFFGGVWREGAAGKPTFIRRRAEFVARRFIRELESIRYVLEHEESRMYSASVLMVYEGDEAALEAAMESEKKDDTEAQVDSNRPDPDRDSDAHAEENDEDEDEEPIPQKIHEVRLIDFAHASWTPGQGPDENALHGIRSLLDILHELVA